MSDSSPNGLVMTPTPRVATMGRWPLYILLAVLIMLGAALIYSVNFVHVPTEEEERSKKATVKEEDKPVWLVEGSGLALDPRKDKTSGVMTPPAKPEQPLVVVQRDEKPDQQAENMRRLKTQSYMNALSAPLVVKRVSTQDSQAVSPPYTGEVVTQAAGKNATSNMPPTGTGNDNYYDPAADRDKEAFFDRARKDTSWQLQEQRTAGMPLELKTGAVIPGVMLTGINSDLPGNMIAQVSQHVFDSATGHTLLIPQGTKIYGLYDSRVVYGQERVLIAWNRLIFPDGSSISIGAMPGADMGGMAGFNDDVNNHYMRIFGSAFMMSLVSGGMAYAMDGANNSLSDSTTTRNGTSMTSEMTAALAQQLGQTTTTLLQKNLSIKPTLEIRPGYQFNIVVTKDMIFRDAYTRWRR